MSDNDKPKVSPVDPEIAQAIVNHYGNYCEGHRMTLQIRDISHRLLHDELVPPNHPVLNAIVDKHQPLPIKDYPALVEMFESLGVYGWPPHDPLIYRKDDDDVEKGPEDVQTQPEAVESSTIKDPEPDSVPKNEEGLTPQEEIDEYVKKMEDEEARSGKGRTTRDQTQNSSKPENNKTANGKDGKAKDSAKEKPAKDGAQPSPGAKKKKDNGDQKAVTSDPIQASLSACTGSVKKVGSLFKAGLVNPVTGVNKRMGRSDLNNWFDTKMEKFDAVQSEVESLVSKIGSDEVTESAKNTLLNGAKDKFNAYASKLEDISEFSDKKIGVARKKRLKEALDKAGELKDKIVDSKDDSEQTKKLFDSISDALAVITSLLKGIFSKNKDDVVNEPAN